ncbi:TetR/AcrR family transcriptional regulator [Roseomonas eburnea]|uniref:TetR/AcrR family transcriptional regulator n=1 Tax=Neoroseomonas eburnea TaxID=1346889 RepID=A0A9X9X7N3_9PROT|nr:TetR/AcrR family transcriptional regulator [Neoroseomonas eburnea]MBR0679719.1 TetR/AcrR family transcriptional regulator [Neoroseomonas eburnea]
MDASVLDGLDLPGVHPARQERSRTVMLALIEAGLELLRDRSFDALSIADLCAAAGVTTGSFYARFESKEAYLRAVQQVVVTEAMRDMEAAPAPEHVPPASLRDYLGPLVANSVRWRRRYEGLIRASLRAARVDEGAWSPLRDLGQVRVERTLPVILGLLGPTASPAAADAVRFAFQILFGTLNNMMLVDPGPFGIHDEATPRLLAEAMVRLIEAEAARA